MHAFVYNANPGRVIFGGGTLSRLPAEVERLGLRRVLVLATPVQESYARDIARQIGDRSAGVFAEARMHTPVEITDRAMSVVTEAGIDGLVAVGGGSTTGLAKAIALRTDLPQIVAPTTYAGSEMTPILGETQGGRKVTQSSPRILPEVVIYDVDLTLTLPVAQSVTSGINAIAHAVEALYTREANPLISMLAQSAIAALAKGLPGIAANPSDQAARSDALYGAWLAGICLGSVGMALHHKLCHTLGGTFDLPHAETHTAVLPHAVAYNRDAAPEAMRAIAQALRVDDAAAGLFDLASSLGATMALRDLGMPLSGIAVATEAALANPYWNPRPLEHNAIQALLTSAYDGARPVRS
jgi:alcohol dehydrogenase class IV